MTGCQPRALQDIGSISRLVFQPAVEGVFRKHLLAIDEETEAHLPLADFFRGLGRLELWHMELLCFSSAPLRLRSMPIGSLPLSFCVAL